MSTDTTVRDQIKGHLQRCFQALDLPVLQINGLTALIYNSMTTPARLYHNAEHVLEVLENLKNEVSAVDPISQLAVLFHDVIYYSLDQKLFGRQLDLLEGVVVEQDGETVALISPPNNSEVSMVCLVFGMSTSTVTDPGRNEFLSALIAVHALKEVLTKPQLLQLTMAIEATIPFRGLSAIQQLYDKGKLLTESYCGKKDDSYVEHAVRQAVIVANSDLGVFRTEHYPAFIDSNWRLLPEWFPKLLLDDDKATLEELQSAISNVLQRPMDTSKIFAAFQGEPDLKPRQAMADRNWAFLRRYLTIRSLTATLVIEVAALLGIEKGIPLTKLALIEQRGAALVVGSKEEPPDEESAKLYRVLKQGRGRSYSWDAKESPLAAAILPALNYTVDLSLQQQRTGLDWIQQMPVEIVLGTIVALAEVFPEIVSGERKARAIAQVKG